MAILMGRTVWPGRTQSARHWPQRQVCRREPIRHGSRLRPSMPPPGSEAREASSVPTANPLLTGFQISRRARSCTRSTWMKLATMLTLQGQGPKMSGQAPRISGQWPAPAPASIGRQLRIRTLARSDAPLAAQACGAIYRALFHATTARRCASTASTPPTSLR